MSEPLRIGIAGLGTVGSAVLALLQRNGTLLASRAGRQLRVVSVSAPVAASAASGWRIPACPPDGPPAATVDGVGSPGG